MDRRAAPSMDRLSCLPDEVLCHILSFLPTKRSVQTSSLSKRWSSIWAHVPSLEFDFNDTANIITKIMLPHKHDIHTFHLRANGNLDGSEEEFQSWIVNLTRRNIRNLVIARYSFSVNMPLPQCLFTCKTLVDLTLSGFHDIPMSGIYLPALKKLKLLVGCNLGLITCFLENAANLQVFEILYITDEQYCWMEPKRVPECLISHLQTVYVHFFRCTKNEFDMVRYILMNAKVLKKMEVHNELIVLKKDFEALRGIALFESERGSPECQLVLD